MADAALVQFLVEALPDVSSDLVYRTVKDNPGADAVELMDVLTALQAAQQQHDTGGAPTLQHARPRRRSASGSPSNRRKSKGKAPLQQGGSAADALVIDDDDDGPGGGKHYAVVPLDAAVSGTAASAARRLVKPSNARVQLSAQQVALNKERAARWEQLGGRRPKEGQASHGVKRTAWQEVQDLRKEEHKKWREEKRIRKRVWTVKDLEEMRAHASETQGGGWSSSTDDRFTRIGKEALELTNQFRKENRLPPLAWHDGLAKIGTKHCEDMGRGDVPVGHAGFDQRVAAYPMPHSAAGENVAMSRGMDDVAKVAVDGWINSPGHRRNLLGNWTHCGIGVTQAGNSAYYLTQMFALSR